MEVATHIVKLNAQTSGRDKIYRLIQYLSKFLRWYWARHGASKSALTKLSSIETTFSTTRKVMRVGKPLDMLLSAISNLQMSGDKIVKYSLISAKLSQVIFLSIDHLLLAIKLGLVTGNSKNLNKIASRFWMIGILANLARDLNDIIRIVRLVRRQRRTSGTLVHREDSKALYPTAVKQVLQNKPLMIDLVKNVTDLFLPLNTLGFVKLGDGALGLLGALSSYLGLLVLWDPLYRLNPS